METSEFGKGFVYNLVLFAKHWWRHFEDLERTNEMAKLYPNLWTEGTLDLWFNGAGDHFFEFEIPEKFKETEIGKLAKELRDEAIERRLDRITTKEDFAKFFDRLELLCRMIDKELGVEDIEADYK